jgi:hypothetical protein
MTWPSVMVTVFGPKGLFEDLVPEEGKAVVAKLAHTEYDVLPLGDKLVLLKALCDASAGCGAVVKVRVVRRSPFRAPPLRPLPANVVLSACATRAPCSQFRALA